MTGQEPAPEAVEAVALHLIRDEVFMRPRTSKQVAADVLPFIRDAIHRDGHDADAIREALGFTRDVGYGVLASELGILVSAYDGTAKRHERWRLLTDWLEKP